VILTLTLNATVDRVLSVPGFRPGGVLRAELKEFIPAGKGFNVSRVLAELGARSVAAGIVGAAEVDFYAETFRELGVEPRLYDLAQPTRSNVTIVDPESDRETHLREVGPKVPGGTIDLLESELFPRRSGRNRTAAPSAGVLAFCGSLPRGITPKRLAGILGSARRFGYRLFVDTSGPALQGAWDLRPEILSINAEELGELSGEVVADPAQALAAARSLLVAPAPRSPCSAKPSFATQGEAEPIPDPLFLVKLGARGALAVTRSAAWRAHPPRISARNTVGAGDAFNAGYLARESAGVPEALGFAAACGAAQAASPAVGRLRRADVERLAGKVRVEPV
jgi:1-phosphofructokinase